MSTQTGETLDQREADSKKKGDVMRPLLASGLVVLPTVSLIASLHGMGASAEQARDTLDEIIEEMNSHSQTYEGVVGGELGHLLYVDENGHLQSHEGYSGEDQLDIDNPVSGETLAADLHSAEAYVTEAYDGDVPSEFAELFAQAENEIANNKAASQTALGSVAAGAVGVAGAVGLTRPRRKHPADPTSVDIF